MQNHVTRIPAVTAALVFAAAALFHAPPASAQTGSELLLKPFPKELRYDNQTDMSFAENAHSKQDPSTDFQLSTYETAGRIRLNPGDVASPRFGYALKYLDLDSNIRGLPDRLVDMSVGVATPVAKIDPWVIAVQASVGYAGDSFFGDGNAYYWRGSIVGVNQLSETDALIIGIDYDRNRTYKPDVPLPGFAYIRRIQSNLLLTAGVPVTSIEWEPVEHLRVELSYLLLDNYHARVGYEVAKGLEVYGSIGQRSEGFFLDGLGAGDSRLLFQQKRAEVGVAYRLKDAGVGERDIEFDGAIGYAWDGEFSTGFDQANSRLLADISDSPYVRFGVQLRF